MLRERHLPPLQPITQTRQAWQRERKPGERHLEEKLLHAPSLHSSVKVGM
jgi:hypothetical protein